MKSNQDKKLDKLLDKLEFKNYMNALFDIYGVLLTEKQKEYFQAYYFEDYSLREIASDMDVSSNAVYDQVKKIEKTLENYEEALKLYQKSSLRNEIIDKLEERISNLEDSSVQALLEELKNIENME